MGVGIQTGFDRRCQPELHVHEPMSLGILHIERGWFYCSILRVYISSLQI